MSIFWLLYCYYGTVVIMETAEVDDRLVWIEERICSALKGNGDEVKALFSNDENRLVLLQIHIVCM